MLYRYIMEYRNELNKIIELRRKALYPNLWIIICTIIAAISNYFHFVLTPILVLIVFYLFYKNIVKAAHAPCPRCGEPFGTKNKLPLGVGGDRCQNCKLELYQRESV
jgi:hypothetical protein